MIRILVAEDSKVVSILLKTILEQEPDMEVIGIAANGGEAVAMAEALKPDLITMDIRMPVMDGFLATRHIMSTRPVPIVVISTSVDHEELQTTFRAIEEGAICVLEKPVGISHPDFERQRAELVETIRGMAEVKVVKRRFESTHPEESAPASSRLPARPELIAIGCSTGGPMALMTLFKGLPWVFPLPIVVAQHMTRGFVGGLVNWLKGHVGFEVYLAEDGQILQPSTVYLAPDGHHLKVDRQGGRLAARLSLEGADQGFRPSANVLLESAAAVCPAQAVGVLLTGMGNDGTRGLLAMRKAGCRTIVQDNASSVVYGMPAAALEADAVDEVVPLARMAAYLAGQAGIPLSRIRGR